MLYSMGIRSTSFFFFFNDTATTEIYTLSLHDALPISRDSQVGYQRCSISFGSKLFARSIGRQVKIRSRIIADHRPRAARERTLSVQVRLERRPEARV